MAYEIETKDGIVVRGIPDDIPADDPRVKAKVAAARSKLGGERALEGMSGTEKFLAGAGKGMTDVGRGIGQMLGLTSQGAVDEAQARDAALSSSGAGMAGDIAGNLALTMAPGVGAQGVLARGAAAVLPKALAPTIAAAGAGAGMGALQPVATGDSRAQQTGIGAIGGVGGDLLARGAARVAQPIMQSSAVQRLLAEGIVPTPGQAAGGVGSRVEQKLESLPLIGDIARSSRDRAQREFNSAALNRAVPPGQPPTTQIGQAGVDEARSGIRTAYNQALAGHVMQPDMLLVKAVDAAKKIPTLPLNKARQKQFDDIMNKNLWERLPANGELPATAVKAEIDRDLGKLAFDLSKSTSPAEEQALGAAVRGARDSVRAWMTRQTGTGPERLAADAAHANKVKVQAAVERAKAANGQFTPFQLQSATQEGQPLRALANDAQQVLGNRVPNSGTADRALLAATLGIGGPIANEYFGGPGYLTALAASPLLLSRGGARYAVGNLPGQQVVSGALRKGAPYAAIGGATGLASLLDEYR